MTDSPELLFISIFSGVTFCSTCSLFGTGLLEFTSFTILGKVGIRLGVRPFGLGTGGGLGENCKSVLSAFAVPLELTVPSFCIRARDVSRLLSPVAVTVERLCWEFEVLVLECLCLLLVLDLVDVFVEAVCLRSLFAFVPAADTGIRVFVWDEVLVLARAARTEVEGAALVSILEAGLDLAVLVTGGRSGTASGSAVDCLGLSGTGRNLL